MNRHTRFPIFFAPDAATADVGTGDISVPVIPSPSEPRNVTEVNLSGNPAIENSPAVRAVEAGKKETNVRGPSDFGMESAEESSERIGLTPKRERDRNTGKFVPKAPQSTPSNQQRPKATTPPAAQKPTPTAQPVAKPVAAEPAAPTKVKIGNEEKTAEEWAAHFKELETKAAAAPKPVEVKQPEPPAKTEAETAAEQQAREEKFLADAAKGYEIPEQELDEILAGGPKGVAKFSAMLARAEMRGRQFGASQLNKLAEHYDQLLAPILNQNQTVQSLMQEAAFLSANPEIKSHPEGAKTFREIKGQMENGYREIQAKVAEGKASRSEQAWAMLYEDMTPEQRIQSMAEHTKAALAKLPAAATPAPVVAKPTPTPKPTAPPVVEKPLSGDRPGTAASPRTETAEQRIAREVNASRGITV